MPRISAFRGLLIYIYHDESTHPGRAHFHARYGDDEASIDIENMEIIEGGLPRGRMRLVVEWAKAHQAELRESWERAGRHEPPGEIEPLP